METLTRERLQEMIRQLEASPGALNITWHQDVLKALHELDVARWAAGEPDSVVYKIRNKDGLYSKGGFYFTWSKSGKTWNTGGALSGHLSALGNRELAEYRNAGAHIVELHTKISPTRISIDTWLMGVKERREKRLGVKKPVDKAVEQRVRELEQQLYRLNRELSELGR